VSFGKSVLSLMVMQASVDKKGKPFTISESIYLNISAQLKEGCVIVVINASLYSTTIDFAMPWQQQEWY
jgi:hypothetical protein